LHSLVFESSDRLSRLGHIVNGDVFAITRWQGTNNLSLSGATYNLGDSLTYNFGAKPFAFTQLSAKANLRLDLSPRVSSTRIKLEDNTITQVEEHDDGVSHSCGHFVESRAGVSQVGGILDRDFSYWL